MSEARSRRFRSSCLGLLSAAALLAAAEGPALAQLQSLQEGLKRATEGMVRSDTVVLDNVAVDLGFAAYKMPKIEFSGANLPRAELAALFDKNATEPLAARLSRVSAKQIAVPELVVEQQVGGERQVTRYRDIVLAEVANGRAASVASAGSSFEIKDRDAGTVSGSMGRLTINDLDTAEAARIYAERAGSAAGPMKRIYGAFAIENLAFTADKGARVRIGRIAGKDFSARPTKDSWIETMKILGAAEKADKASPAEQQRVMGAFADLFEAMQVGSMEAAGIEIGDADPKEGSGRIARIAYTGATAAQPSDLRVEGMEISAKDGSAKIGLIAFTGFSFGSTFAELRALGDKPMKDLDVAALRRLIPTIGTIRLSGLDFDVPNEASKEAKPENIRFSVKDIEVTADKPLNGIPTNIRVGVQSFHMPLPADTKEDGLKDLVAMGYRAIDLSWLTAASWNEPGNELLLREISASGAGMGSVSLRGTVGGVGKDVFNTDSAVALVALLGATVKNAQLTIENSGLFEKLVEQEAKKQNKSAADLRRDFGVAAAVAIPAMLGNSGQAKAIGQAVAKFVARPGKLSIAARTKDPAGLGVADLASIGEPGAILDKLEVTATAE